MGNVAMVVTLSFLLIAPWILGELYREPAENEGRSPKPVSTCCGLKRLFIRATHKPGMANTPGKDDRLSDEEALRFAEQTDVSPRQA